MINLFHYQKKNTDKETKEDNIPENTQNDEKIDSKEELTPTLENIEKDNNENSIPDKRNDGFDSYIQNGEKSSLLKEKKIIDYFPRKHSK